MKVLLDFIAAVAWPAAILTIALIYRKPIYELLEHIGGLAHRATTQPFKVKVGSMSVEFKEAVIAKKTKTIEEAVDVAANVAERLVPDGIPVPGRPSLVPSPFGKGLFINVEGFAPGTEVKDPYTDKIFRVPEPRT